MKRNFSIHRIYAVISPLFRRRRMNLFLRRMQPTAETRILDVGGYPWNWMDCAVNTEVTILNVHPIEMLPQWSNGRFKFVLGDGCSLDYEDQSFDIVFSNSVIEHVGTWDRQVAFAMEMRRVGKALWIQTPARSFFFEPHLLTPFIHYFPTALQKPVLRHFTVWGLMTKPTRQEVDTFLKETRLINGPEMRQLFPDCEILHERLVGLTKSFIAVRDRRA